MNMFVLDRNNIDKVDENSYSMKYVGHADGKYIYSMCKSHWVDGTLVNEDILVEFASKGDVIEAAHSLKETYGCAKHIADGDIIIMFEMIIPNGDDNTTFSGAITNISFDRTNYLYVNSAMGVERYEGSIAKYHQFNRVEGDTRPIWGITMWMERRFADKSYTAEDVYRYYKSYIDRRIREYNEFHEHDLGSETING